MKGRLETKLLGIALIAASAIALGEEARRQPTQFVGVLEGQITGAAPDSTRCPDPLLPLRIDVRGSAHTTLGRARYAQTHCEDLDHTVVSAGILTVSFDDGTKLLGAYHGSILVTPTTAADSRLMVTGQYRNLGGTGALATARGMGITVGAVDVSTYTVILALSGTL